MSNDDRYVKTALGIEEIKTRKHKLPQKLRNMLILIDEKTSFEVLRSHSFQIDMQADWLEVLERGGFIEPYGAKQASHVAQTAISETDTDSALSLFNNARKLMSDSLVETQGVRSLLITLKLDRCSKMADLRALFGDYEVAIRKGRAEPDAQKIVLSVSKLLE